MKQKMLKFFIFVAAMMSVVACGARTSESEQTASDANEHRVEVIYFHGKQRCLTCMAIEKLAREVVETQFASAVASGELVFRVVDISTKEGERIADRYEVTWSSIFVNRVDGKREKVNNLTDFAFANARSNPDKFKQGVTDKINELIK